MSRSSTIASSSANSSRSSRSTSPVCEPGVSGLRAALTIWYFSVVESTLAEKLRAAWRAAAARLGPRSVVRAA